MGCIIEVFLSVFYVVILLYFYEAAHGERVPEGIHESPMEPVVVSWLFRTLDFSKPRA